MTDVGAVILEIPPTVTGRVDLKAAMKELRDRGVSSLLCEGGGVVASALLGEALVDRLYLALVPQILGPAGVPAFPGLPAEAAPIPQSHGWRFGEPPRQLGRDLWLALRPTRGQEN
jgi:riboflavin biosynthesis pyrimidine reductase